MIARTSARRRRLRSALFETLEARHLLTSYWRNPADPLDVSEDGHLSPVDALLVINELNEAGARRLTVAAPPARGRVDVDGDRYVAPIDALRVINGLNSGVRPPTGDGEGLPHFTAIGMATLPGGPDEFVEIAATWQSGTGGFVELGLVPVDAQGRIDGVTSDDEGFVDAALASDARRPVILREGGVYVSRGATFVGGQSVAVYAIDDDPLWRAPNEYLRSTSTTSGQWRIGWEDAQSVWPGLGAVGDRGYDDAVVRLDATTIQREFAFQAIPDQTVDEQTPLTLSATTTHPLGRVAFELVAGPPGATVDAATGEFRWTPSESDGPGVQFVTIAATNSFGQRLTEDFRIDVREVNRAPELSDVARLQIDEGQTASFRLVAQDPDLPVNRLSFSLVSAPDGATLDEQTGEFHWDTDERAGGGVYVVRARVTDDGSPPLADEIDVTIDVREVNTPPSLDFVPDQSIDEQTLWQWTLAASDADFPAQTLGYELFGTVPAGLMLDASTGVLRWTPGEAQGPGRYAVSVRVNDSGSPSLSAVRTFHIDVREVNRAPELAPIGDRVLVPGRTLNVVALATDPDVPANGVSYTFVGEVPPNATIDPATGEILWTPLEEHAGARFDFTVRATDDGTPALFDDETFQVTVTTCEFAAGLDGWTVDEAGGSEEGRGTASADGCGIRLREGDSFVVALETAFTIPAEPHALQVFFSDLTFDTTDPSFINDAFELALVDDDGRPLVASYLAGRDAFLNATEQMGTATGSGVVVTGDGVTGAVATVGLNGLPAGLRARLIVRLVNDDADVDTRVTIDRVELVADARAAAPPQVDPYSLARSFAQQDRLIGAAAQQVAPLPIGPMIASTGAPFTPPQLGQPRDLAPTLEWSWNGSTVEPDSRNVMMTPAVIDLNGDGVAEILFTTFAGDTYTSAGRLRAVNGATGEELWTVVDPAFALMPTAHLAVGDIDADGSVDIVAFHESSTLMAFNADGSFKWFGDVLGVQAYAGGASLADLNADGRAEIIYGARAYDSQGRLLWDGYAGGGSGQGSSAGYGAHSVVVDLDLDGVPEVVAGNSAYRHDGTVAWNSPLSDGYVAAGNFDDDLFPELVLVSDGQVNLLDHAGQVVWGPFTLSAGLGGPPTVADFDGDGRPEIGVVSRTSLVALEHDGTFKWSVPIQENSFAITGLSVFDFDGDGRAEVAYGDEDSLELFDGTDGSSRFSFPRGNATVTEYPVVADVDGDGAAELVVVATTADGIDVNGTQGVYVFGGADGWAGTRPIWNQHTYHITNIADDGAIPAHEEAGWLVYNSYRQNRQTSGTRLGPPLLSVASPDSTFRAGTTIVLSGRATAQGTLPGGAANRIDLVTLDGAAVESLDAGGDFFARVVIQPGVNTFRFTAVDAAGQSVSTTLELRGVAGDAIDFARYADVTDAFRGVYYRTSFDEATDRLFVDLATRNDGTFVNDVPLLVGVKNLSDPQVTPLDVDGFTPDGIPYYDFTRFASGGRLAPGEETSAPSIALHNPNRGQFDYELVFWGRLNEPPYFTTVPPLDVATERAYSYNAQAADPNDDVVSYALLVAPAGMSIDPSSGRIAWTPAAAQLGLHEVVVQADDGRGGTATQTYRLNVTPPPPNRPPVFVTTPVLEATVVERDEPVPTSTKLIFTNSQTQPNVFELSVEYDGSEFLVGTPIPLASVPQADGVAVSLTHPELLYVAYGDFHVVNRLTGEYSTLIPPEYVAHLEMADEDTLFGNHYLSGAPVRFELNDDGSVAHAQVVQLSGDDTSVSQLISTPAGYYYATQASDVGEAFGRLTFTSDFSAVTTRLASGFEGAHTGSFDPYTNTIILAGHSFLTQFDLQGNIVSRRDFNDAFPGVGVGFDQGSVDGHGRMFMASASNGHLLFVDYAATGLIGAPENFVALSFVQIGLDDVASLTAGFVTPVPENPSYDYDSEAVDPDQDVVSYRLIQSPGGMTIDSRTGRVLWAPTAEQVGHHDVAIEATDGRGGVATQRYQVCVLPDPANHAPTIVSEPVVSTSPGPYEYLVQAVDPDEDGLHFQLSSGPDGMTIDADSGRITWQAPTTNQDASYPVAVSVGDGRGGVDRQEFVLVVSTTLGAIRGTKFDDQNGDGRRTAENLLANSDFSAGYDGFTSAYLESSDLTPPGVMYVGTSPQQHNSEFASVSDHTSSSGRMLIVNGETQVAQAVWQQTVPVTPYTDYRFQYWATAVHADNPARLQLYVNDRLVGGEWQLSDIVGQWQQFQVDWNSGTDTTATLSLENYVVEFGGNDFALDDFSFATRTGVEPVLANWPVFLDQNRNGRRDLDERLTTTDADGNYEFANLPAGTYYVRESQPSGWTQTFPRGQSTGLEWFGQLNYQSFGDSPFRGHADELYLEDFEDGVLDLPGVRVGASPVPLTVGPPSFVTDSVDADDGVIDGSGTDGHVFGPLNNDVGASNLGVRFEFVRDELGSLPTYAGLVWTDGTPYDTLTFEAFDASGESLGTLRADQIGDDDFSGTTEEDRFFGLRNRGGISAIAIHGLAVGQNSFEVDHLQYGWDRDGRDDHVVRLAHGETVRGIDFGNQRTGTSANRAPVLEAIPDQSIDRGERLRLTIPASDADDRPLTFDLPVAPDGMTIHPTLGTLVWIPDAEQTGEHRVVVRVRDEAGEADLASFLVHVRAPNHAPLFVSEPTTVYESGTDYRYAISALDPDGDVVQVSLVDGPNGMNLETTSNSLVWPAGDVVLDSYEQLVLADAPNGYWRLGESLGTTALDSSAGQFHGTYSTAIRMPAAGAIVGTTDGALAVNGAENRVEIPHAPPFNPERLSVETWVRPGGTSGNYVSAVMKTSSNAWDDGYGVYTTREDQISFFINQYTNSVTATIDTGEWNHVVGTYDGVSMRLYVNGLLAAQADYSQPIVHSTGSLVIGDSRNLGSYAWPGQIDDVAVYGRALDAETIGVHAAGRPGARIALSASDGRATATQTFFVTERDDVDNRALQITSTPRNSTPLNLTYVYPIQAYDADRETLEFRLLEGPPQMTIDARGVLRWTPDADDLGEHAIRLRVVDGGGAFAEQTYTLAVTNVASNFAPTITSSPRVAAIQGEEYRYDAVALDRDHDPIAWSLAVAPEGMYVDPATGTIRWTPDQAALGEHLVVLSARDAYFGVDEQRFVVTVRCENTPPTIVSTPSTLAYDGRPYRYAVRAEDREGDALTYRLLGAPAGMSIDRDTGLIRWTPTLAQRGDQEVRIQVTDATGLGGTQAYRIVVGDPEAPVDPQNPVSPPAGNHAPYVTSTPTFVGEASFEYQYDVQALDIDGDAISFELGDHPSGMTIDAETGLVRWIPAVGQVGEHDVAVVARDAHGATSTQGFVVLVEQNRAPVITSVAPQTVVRGADYRYAVRATDPDGDPLTYSLSAGAPAGMTVDARNGRVLWDTTGAALGAYSVEVVVADDHGQTARQAFSIEVMADTTGPVVRLAILRDLTRITQDATFDAGTTLRVQVSASDDVEVVARELYVDGRVVPLDSRFEAVIPALRLGATELRAVARDAAGNLGESRLVVTAVAPGSDGAPSPTDPNVPPHPGRFDPADQLPPTIVITSPQTNDTVSDLTPIIGTVDDPEDNLWFYRVYAGRLDLVNLDQIDTDDPDWKVLHTGTSEVVNGQLAVFDPSMLTKDPYAIIVAAYDVNGRGFIQPTVVLVEGQATIGNFRLDFTDLTLPLAGIPIQVMRSYDTLNAGVEGDFGYGWSLGVQDARILETVPSGTGFVPFKSKVYLTNPAGRSVGYTFEPVCQGSLFGAFCTPTFKPDPGVYDQLLVEGQFGLGGVLGALSGPFNPDAYTLVTPDGTRYDYDQFDGLRKITDQNGNTVTFSDTGIEHSSGASIDFVRDHRGRIKEIHAPQDQGPSLVLRYEYDAAGDLVRFVNQIDLSTRYEYLATPAHYLDRGFDSLERTAFAVFYDADGRFVEVRDALGNVIDQRSYDVEARTAIVRDANGNATTLRYDERGNVLEETDPLGRTTIRRYEDPLNPDSETTIIDRRGNETAREYDARGNVTRIVERGSALEPLDPPIVTEFQYDASGHVTSIVNALERTTVFSYDAAGHVTQITNALGNSSGFAYDDQGRRQAFTDFNGHTTQFQYDAACPCGSPSTVVFADGTYQTFEYNQYGQVTAEASYEADDTLVLSRTTTYDALGRVLEEKSGLEGDPNHPPTVVRKVYDGHLLDYEMVVHPNSPDETPATPIASRLSRITDYEYDALDRVVRQIDAEGGVVEFRYDAQGNRVLLQDPVGNITTWVFDSNNRVSEERDPFYNLGLTIDQAVAELAVPSGASCATNTPAEHVTLSCYDGEGNRTKKIDRNARRSEFDYDYAGRLIEERWYAAGTEELVRTINIRYDALGNMLEAQDPDSRYVYTYDALNRQTSVDNAGTPGAPHVILYYAYDAQGNAISTSDNFGVTVASTYNSRNLLETRLWYDALVPPGETPDVDPVRVDFLYNAAGRETRLDRYSDLTSTTRVGHTATTYDLSGRTDTIVHRDAVDALIASYDYGYDFGGLVTTEVRDHRDDQYDDDIEYRYDLTGQLTDALFDAQDDEHYEYDANGNRTYSRVGTEERFYVTGTANQLLSDGVNEYEYDGEGNMVQRANPAGAEDGRFVFDHRNRMTVALIFMPSGATQVKSTHKKIVYDGRDRRIGQETATSRDGNSFTQRTYLTNDHDDYWGEVTDGSRQWTLTGRGVDRILAIRSSETGTKWTFGDNQFTVRDSWLQSLDATERVTLTAFGVPVHASTTSAIIFMGRDYNDQLRLYNFRARHFDPSIGRFASTDPLGFDASDVLLYRFVRNSPKNWMDPSGRIALADAVIWASTAFFALLTFSSIADAQEAMTLEDCMALVGGDYDKNLVSTAIGEVASAGGHNKTPSSVQTSFALFIGCYIRVHLLDAANGIASGNANA